MRFCALFLGVGLLAGCAATIPAPGNSTALSAVEIALTASERAATIYVSLPLCPVTNGTLCSDAATTVKIKAADRLAYAAVQTAKGGGSVTLAITAIGALTVLIPVSLTPPV